MRAEAFYMYINGEIQMRIVRIRNALAIVLTVSALMLGQRAYATPIAHLVLESQPGDFIGLGLNFDVTYTPDNSDFFFPQIRRTIGPTNEPAELLFVLGTVTGARQYVRPSFLRN